MQEKVLLIANQETLDVIIEGAKRAYPEYSFETYINAGSYNHIICVF